MGCGASVHAQGTSPLLAGSEQGAEKEVSESNKNVSAPIAEDLKAVKDPQVKGVEQPIGTAPSAGGGPGVAAPGGAAPDDTPPSDTSTSRGPQFPAGGGQADDPLLLASSASVAASARSETTPVEPLQLQPSSSSPSQPQLPPLPHRSAPAAQPWQATAPSASSPQWPQSPAQQQQRQPQGPPSGSPSQRAASPASGGATNGGGCASPNTTRLVLAGSVSSGFGDLDPRSSSPTPLGSRGMSSGVLDPAITPTSQTATVTLLPNQAPGGGAAPSRYTDAGDLAISAHSYDLDGGGGGSDDDDDELDALFTLQAWKRYYSYNKKKARDLLKYFWRRFPPDEYSCFCVSYRNQDLFVLPFMAENCMHGYCARLEDLGLVSELFLQMVVLHDPELDQYRIVGLLLVPGQTLPPPLAALAAFDGFVYQRAETGRTLVKQFLSALLLGVSPMYSLRLVSAREVL